MTVTALAVQELHRLTELYDYNDVDEMIAQCTYEIQNNITDIFVLSDGLELIGELHARYRSDDDNFAVQGRRAYLFAFRIHKNYQGKGYGKYLIRKVIEILKERGYSEFTVGVEDDNLKAQHIYRSLGFDERLLRKKEEYQGDSYEYSLYLMR
ncbi:MAG: GNAT family N-acetyltransferase [Firmicutes bacterium]|nr:GNAT family N-acetyltransferase [[Eubacterium] siraeum]MCM1488858.1 GNAT family N-acetyltransferase [Bacillota bacterium]